MDMVYNERIKPLVKAKQEAELLEDESDEVRQEVREKYSKQKKVEKGKSNYKDDDDNEIDADAIAKCHPSETPAGSNFAQLCPDKDNTFLAKYQQYAELIFSMNECNPLLQDVTGEYETKELERCNGGGEASKALAEENGEDTGENNEGSADNSMDWDRPGLASSSTGLSDASITCFRNTEASISDASLDHSGFYSEAKSDASLKQAPNASLKHALPDVSLDWQDDFLPHFTSQDPILPAANLPSPNEGAQDLAEAHTGTGLAKSKRKCKPKPSAAKVKGNPTMDPTPAIAPTITSANAAKPKVQPLAKSGVIMETSHTAATALNTATTTQNPRPAVNSGAAPHASKRVLIKSRRNEIADAIGSGGTSTKRLNNATMEGMIPTKKICMKA
ncbi:hypothetical protein DFH29DRAFT_1007371 [Suillus ampliporus]|nr:hypothetical protein DFH29DRAFT_1007371 [Suillus ampliporus]